MDQAYLDWITKEAKSIGSDGCTFIGKLDGQLHEVCCYEHDLGYHYAKDPRDAYNLYVAGRAHYWDEAKPIERVEVDHRFRICNESQSPLGKFSPIAWGRWLGVRAGGWRIWRAHRKEDKLNT